MAHTVFQWPSRAPDSQTSGLCAMLLFLQLIPFLKRWKVKSPANLRTIHLSLGRDFWQNHPFWWSLCIWCVPKGMLKSSEHPSSSHGPGQLCPPAEMNTCLSFVSSEWLLFLICPPSTMTFLSICTRHSICKQEVRYQGLNLFSSFLFNYPSIFIVSRFCLTIFQWV